MINEMSAKVIGSVVEMYGMKAEFCKAIAKSIPGIKYDEDRNVVYAEIGNGREASNISCAVYDFYNIYINPLACTKKVFTNIRNAVANYKLESNRKYLLGWYNFFYKAK